MRVLIAAVLAGALAGCGKPAQPAVEGAWVRLSAVPGRPAAAYFTLNGGSTDATLIAVRTMSAGRAELHESMANGMRAIAAVPVPAGGAVVFAPGGRHVMLFDVDPKAAPGKAMTLYLILGDNRSLTAPAKVVAAGDPAP